MKYVYLSSGEFGAKVLENLDPRPVLVVTQPDRLGGRGMKTRIQTPVAQKATELQLPLKKGSTLFECDLAVVADYGVIIKSEDLNKPKYGFWNIHPSLLPKYRGTTPLQTALLNGDTETGVSLIQLDDQIDHGPILAQEKLAIDPNDTYLTLLQKTACVGASLFAKTHRGGVYGGKAQNHGAATYTKKLTKQDGFVPLEKLTPYLTPLFKKYNLAHLLSKQAASPIDQLKLHNMIRALNPWPGVWTRAGEKVIKISDRWVNIDGKRYLADYLIQY